MKIVVGDNLVNFLDLGDKTKPTVVFLHGWLDNLHSFTDLVKFFENDYRITLIDLPGFGESTLINTNADISYYVEFLNSFVTKLEIQPLAFIGHSFGGRILIKAFGDKVFRTEKIVLISTAGIKESNSLKNKIYFVLGKIMKLFLSLPILNIVSDKVKDTCYKIIGSDYRSSQIINNVYQNIIKEDLQDSAKKINISTLLIYGENDDVTPVSYGVKFQQLIPNSKLSVIKNADHFVHKKKVLEVADLIKKFLV